ncbi:TPA: hypothetical protein JAJ91_001581 [Corynebacterium striatum]|nr:hypothetical protein [Corynebacterium striatum]HAT6424008.1 hypothetical protein [Corynebacterium striatum]HAT6487155.1 hypothetical protein [Corynebacterium striatum]
MANRWKHRNTPHNLVSDFSVRIMGSSSPPRKTVTVTMSSIATALLLFGAILANG